MWANGDPDNPEGPVWKIRVSYNLPGHAHELTFSCHRRLPLLNRDRTRNWFVDALAAARRKQEFELWAYVVMPEHAHALIFPTSDAYDIAKVLASIKLPVARRAITWLRENSPEFLEQLRVERPSGRVEFRFWAQGGGYDRNITKIDTAWASIKYLHDNPVRRGLVTRAVDWPWSSARCYSGEEPVLLHVDNCPH